MCITFFSLKPNLSKNNQLQFFVAFNRDERMKRQTIPFGCWKEDKNIYGGKDLLSNGTWLGINIKTGILVFLTNYRIKVKKGGLSRGKLVKRFLKTNFIDQENWSSQKVIMFKIMDEMRGILKNSESYAAFNLVVYEVRGGNGFYICSELGMKEPLKIKEKEVYGLSNADIFTKWPKTEEGIKSIQILIKQIEKDKIDVLMDKLERVMKNGQKFEWQPKVESSIFIDPYYSEEFKDEITTKSTFLGVFTKQKESINFHLRQITYKMNKQEQVSKMLLTLQTH